MTLKIITNNPKVQEICISNNYDFIFIPNHARKLLFDTRDLLLNGWKLAVDPLAGYLSRPNPYHTIILQANFASEPIADDILRIETAINQWHRYNNIIEMTERLNSDYCALDFSLAVNTLQSLLRNPLYYTGC